MKFQYKYTIIYVKDLDATISFYKKAFGFSTKLIDDSGYAELDTGETTIAFAAEYMLSQNTLKANLITPNSTPPALELAFVTENVQKAHENAIKHGASELREPTQTPWGQTVSYVKDINGLIIELCTPIEQ